MRQDELFSLIDKLNNGDISDSEKKKLMDFYNQYQSSLEWKEDLMGKQKDVKESIAAKIGMLSVVPSPKRSKIRTFFLRSAAAVLIVGLTSFFLLKFFSLSPEVMLVESGKHRKEVKLPDGSIVVLNVNSSLRYPSSFAKDRREVTFTGEGYFDVQSDSLHPFVVSTPHIKVRVLGTAFNLKAYDEDHSVEASLIHGKIEMLKTEGDEVISILRPNEKFVMKKPSSNDKESALTNLEIAIKPIEFIKENEQETPADLAWKDGKFAFVSMPLQEIAREMSRRFNVDIVIENKEIADSRYSATFEKESLNEMLRALTIVKAFSYRKEGQTIVIY